MKKIIDILFNKAFTHLVNVVATLLRPTLAGLPLSYTVLSVVFGHVGTIAGNQTPVYTAVGDYTAAEIQELSTSIAAIVTVVLDEFKLTGVVTRVQIAELLEAVAVRLTPPATAPAA